MELLSLTQFAVLHGVSKPAVTKWKKRGLIVFEGDQVNVEASNAELKKYRRDSPVNSKVNQTKQLTVQPGETAADAADRVLLASGAEMDLEEARRVKENYLALLNQLEYDQKSGLVVPVEDVARVADSKFAKARTRLLAIPAEQSPRLHRLKTVTEVQDALQEIITEALEELTQHGGR